MFFIIHISIAKTITQQKKVRQPSSPVIALEQRLALSTSAVFVSSSQKALGRLVIFCSSEAVCPLGVIQEASSSLPQSPFFFRRVMLGSTKSAEAERKKSARVGKGGRSRQRVFRQLSAGVFSPHSSLYGHPLLVFPSSVGDLTRECAVLLSRLVDLSLARQASLASSCGLPQPLRPCCRYIATITRSASYVLVRVPHVVRLSSDPFLCRGFLARRLIKSTPTKSLWRSPAVTSSGLFSSVSPAPLRSRGRPSSPALERALSFTTSAVSWSSSSLSPSSLPFSSISLALFWRPLCCLEFTA